MKALTIRVYGKVQGVWFRASTQKKALELNIKGTVRNKPDGSVFIEAEGAANDLDQFLKWCHDGPTFARVDHVDTTIAEPANFDQFSVIRH